MLYFIKNDCIFCYQTKQIRFIVATYFFNHQFNFSLYKWGIYVCFSYISCYFFFWRTVFPGRILLASHPKMPRDSLDHKHSPSKFDIFYPIYCIIRVQGKKEILSNLDGECLWSGLSVSKFTYRIKDILQPKLHKLLSSEFCLNSGTLRDLITYNPSAQVYVNNRLQQTGNPQGQHILKTCM